METASTWQSFEISLRRVMERLKPKHCFEWGSGASTHMISEYEFVESLDSVEHDPGWVDRVDKQANKKVMMIYEPDRDMYKHVTGRRDFYDLVFIDGRDRENCLIQAHYILEPDGVAILHDAERELYRCSIESYKYKIWEDDGHTVILTNCEETYEKIKSSNPSA